MATGRVGGGFHIPRPRHPVSIAILAPVPAGFKILNPIPVPVRVRGNPPRTHTRLRVTKTGVLNYRVWCRLSMDNGRNIYQGNEPFSLTNSDMNDSKIQVSCKAD
ncbi:hypothetical protein VNO77_25903 [Canavalia gladiata]|uniref:Uncharacterized protein n=1 Tax=Canavalia gladiata TaxID=3824 RepID=A0AAN9Q2Y8_CANGL